MSELTDAEFQKVMSSIAGSRRHTSGVEIEVFFKPITNNYKLSEFRDFLSSRYNMSRSEKHVFPDGSSTQNSEGISFENQALRQFDKRFSRDDILVIYFKYSDDWVSIIKFGAYVANKDMIGGRIGGFLLLPLAIIFLACEKVKRFVSFITK